MKHLFVPYEIALKLKEKGFDEPCLGWYWDNGKELSFGFVTSDELTSTASIAPLYQQVIDWFREKHAFYLSPEVNCENGWHQIRIYRHRPRLDHFQSSRNHYEALNKAIEEALKLI